MTKSHIGGLTLFSIGACTVLLVQTFVLMVKAPDAVQDLIGSYYSAHCLIHRCDPYSQADVFRTFTAEGGERLLSDSVTRDIVTRYLYPPSTFVVMMPFSLMRWRLARIMWAVVSSSSLIVAAYLCWDLCASNAPTLSGALIAYLLANSYVIVVLSNPSALAISLSVAGVWCFIRQKAVAVGVFSFALSLAIKPQVSGLLWLYFLLAGGVLRKRALQTFLVTIVASLPFIFWVCVVSPHWYHEWRDNLSYFSAYGGITDPGPSSRTANDLVDLQVILSRFCDRPNFYDHASYVILAPILLVWVGITLETKASEARMLYGIAAIIPLSMLPMYHHFYDTKLLLLTVPATSLLWRRRDRVSWLALFLGAVTFFFTGDISRLLLLNLGLSFHPWPSKLARWLADAFLVFPAPLILFVMGVFYLWVYWRETKHRSVLESEA